MLLRVFIGYDSRETAAYHVLAHSIQARASKPVAIIPVDLRQLRDVYTRLYGSQSTEFTYSRFLVPYLSGFEGFSVFMDCDMLCRTDIAALFERNYDKAVWVCQHDYKPRPGDKFLGQPQVAYPRKNWSSLMVFNNAVCRALSPTFVNLATPATLHRFAWTPDELIGELPLEWNYLVDEDGQSTEDPKIVHFTNGGPWFPGYEHVEYADEWRGEYERMTRLG